MQCFVLSQVAIILHSIIHTFSKSTSFVLARILNHGEETLLVGGASSGQIKIAGIQRMLKRVLKHICYEKWRGYNLLPFLPPLYIRLVIRDMVYPVVTESRCTTICIIGNKIEEKPEIIEKRC